MQTRQLILEPILVELEKLHRGGVRITQRDLRKAGHRDLLRAVDRLGGLQRLRRLAGIPFHRDEPHRQVPDSEAVIAEIRRRYLRREPLWLTRIPSELRVAAERHFGSWKNALARTGLNSARVSRRRRYSDSALLEEVRSLAAQRPDMTLTELDRHRIGSTLRTRFGSLTAAAARAGVRHWPRRKTRA